MSERQSVKTEKIIRVRIRHTKNDRPEIDDKQVEEFRMKLQDENYVEFAIRRIATDISNSIFERYATRDV